jgi:hypothetical protein
MAKYQRVVCAAIKHRTGLVVAGARHWDGVMCKMVDIAIPNRQEGNSSNWEEGFLNDQGEFLTRNEALTVAKNSGQVSSSLNTDKLYSADLY